MNKIENTTSETEKMALLLTMLTGGSSGAIEAQEDRGQQQLVSSDVLPVDVRGDKSTLEDDGVVFGDPLPNDKLFCSVHLPDGWNKRPTNHSMWSELVDTTGRVRAMIFYKAAFYDRCAFMNVE